MIGERNIDFQTPTRQSYVAILLILYKVYSRFIKQFWYLLIPFFIGKKSSSQYLIYSLVAIAIILSIYSIVSFFRYRFHLENDNFVVEKGVFSRKRIVIPFDRIQSINFKQNIIQQVFRVVGLEIDTAGTSKKEFDFDALDINLSKALRDYIFKNKKEAKVHGNVTEINVVNEIPSKTILNLSLGDLIKIGLTQNHFRSLFFAIFSLYWIVDQVEKMGVKVEDYANITEENILKLGLYMIGVLVIFALILIIVISIVRNVLRYYNLKLIRIPNGFKLEYGLFNRNEISVPDNKMQVIKWSDNLLRKILKLYNLHIKLASSIAVKQQKSIIIPGSKINDIRGIKEYYFPNGSSEINSFNSINIYYLWRRIGIIVSLFLGISILLFTLSRYTDYELSRESFYIPFVLMIYFIFTSYLRFNKFLYGFNQEVIQINSGIFGNKYALYAIYKLQGVEIAQSPVQLRKDLADVVIFSSSGIDRIKYIDMQNAEKIRDFILYKIETDKREWM